MRFAIDATNAAINNGREAKQRETMRMLMLGWCLRRLGHEVVMTASEEQKATPRWEYFKDMDGELNGDVLVVSAETRKVRASVYRAMVGFRTSVGCMHDLEFIESYDVLVATEHDLAITNHPKLLPIPFAVHDDMVTMFMASGEMERYLTDDLTYFRTTYAEPKVRRAGFAGCGSYGRMPMVAAMPPWCEARFDKYEPIREYVRYIAGCEAGLLLAGDVPKSYRFSELVLFGIPVITTPIATRVVPPLTSENCIEVRDWDDWPAMEAGMLRLDEVRRGADRDYVAGWSIMGQAKQLAEMLRPIV